MRKAGTYRKGSCIQLFSCREEARARETRFVGHETLQDHYIPGDEESGLHKTSKALWKSWKFYSTEYEYISISEESSFTTVCVNRST